MIRSGRKLRDLRSWESSSRFPKKWEERTRPRSKESKQEEEIHRLRRLELPEKGWRPQLDYFRDCLLCCCPDCYPGCCLEIPCGCRCRPGWKARIHFQPQQEVQFRRQGQSARTQSGRQPAEFASSA